MNDFIEELNKFKGVSLERRDGNKLVFQRLSDRKRMSLMVYDSKENVFYIVGYITNEKKLRDIFLD